MHREGHHGLNALLYAPIALGAAVFGSVELSIIGALFFVGTASIPDFDRHFDSGMSHKNWLWKLVPIKHRGFTHTVWFAVLGGGVGAFLAAGLVPMVPQQPPVLVIVFGGVCTTGGLLGHILGDAMTPMGVRPFSPLKRRKYTFGWFLAKNPIANYGFLVLGGAALFTALGYGFSVTGIDPESHSAAVAEGVVAVISL